MCKTTTIGKIASRITNELNMTVLLGACDTFRAAAVEQLAEWSKRANVSIEMPLGKAMDIQILVRTEYWNIFIYVY